MAKKQVEKQRTISIPQVEFSYAKITLLGETPLVVQKFSEKAKREMEEKTQRRAKGPRAARNPEQEFLDALYVIKPGIFGVPVGGLKNAAVSACRFIEGFPMTKARGAFHIISDAHGLIPIEGSKPVMHEGTVRIGGFKKIAQIRYRPLFEKWALTFTVKYAPNIISAEQLLNLFEVAGFSVGLCEGRPEKSSLGWGQFKVKRR